MTTSEILRRAKARLTPATWGQCGPTATARGHLCADNAIMVDICMHVDVGATQEARRLFAQVVSGGVGGALIWRWNDDARRTLQDVYDAFDAAIVIAEQREAVELVPA